MQYLFLFVVATIACINAAPAEINDSAQKQFATDLKEAFEPVQNDLRALYDNTQFAVKDLAEQGLKAGNELVLAGKELLSPVSEQDRANMPGNLVDRMRSLAGIAKDLGRELMTSAKSDSEPIVANEKSAFLSAGGAISLLQNKYLTDDGKDLVKSLSSLRHL